MLKLKENATLGRKDSLNEEGVNKLIALYNANMSWDNIAIELGVCRGTVGNYLKRIRAGEYED